MPNAGTDPLSPLAHAIIDAGAYARLVVPDGTPDKARELLAAVTPDQLFAAPVLSGPHAYAALAGLWLWHDALDEGHKIAQQSPADLHRAALNLHSKGWNSGKKVRSVQSVENAKKPNDQQLRDAEACLSFWHAIMHRREGDFSNAKYWYARCRAHPAMRAVIGVAGAWDPGAFVDGVNEVYRNPDDPGHATAVDVQRREWQALFAYCASTAVGLTTL